MKTYYTYDITECRNINGVPSGFGVEVNSKDLLELRREMYKYLAERKISA